MILCCCALQDLNALPFAAMAVNCASWVFYALLYKDYYIYFGNLPGMLMGMFYVLTCYKFSKEAVRHRGSRDSRGSRCCVQLTRTAVLSEA
jgi:hypothetical protein